MMFARMLDQPDLTDDGVVYAIEHHASGAAYLGKSRNWPRREGKHRSDLRNGIHHNAPLQAVATRDGLASLAFNVWWTAPADATNALLCEAEHAAMELVRRMGRPLLNVLRPATRFGRAFSIGAGGRGRRLEPVTETEYLFDVSSRR
jgi:predicted GIY-YIG superfamily endonuclease